MSKKNKWKTRARALQDILRDRGVKDPSYCRCLLAVQELGAIGDRDESLLLSQLADSLIRGGMGR